MAGALATFSWTCSYNIPLTVQSDPCSTSTVSLSTNTNLYSPALTFDLNPGTSVIKFTFNFVVNPPTCVWVLNFLNSDLTTVDSSVFTITGSGIGPYSFNVGTTDPLKVMAYSLLIKVSIVAYPLILDSLSFPIFITN